MYSISVCQTKAEKNLFEKVAEILHQSLVDFIPPFPGSIAKFLDSESEFQRIHGPILALIAWENGKPVGRLAAIVNRSHNIYHQDTTGFFGFFACIDSCEVAQALFSKAETWLREQGCTSIRGPYNPSINEECGLIVEGFEGPPFVGMTWNPAYYEPLLQHCGLSRIREMVAFLLDTTKPSPDRVLRILERLARRGKMTKRSIQFSRLNEELELLQYLYNSTLDRNWGFVPISYADLHHSADEFRYVADPNMIMMTLDRGKPAAFVINFSNFQEILLAAKHVPAWLRLPYLLFKMKTHRYRTSRLAVLGVAPDYRDQGLSAWLMGETMKRSNERYQEIEISWIEGNNDEIIRNSEMMGGRIYRHYAIFEKAILPALIS